MHESGRKATADSGSGRLGTQMCFFIAALLIAIGCSRSSVELAEVTGRVTMGGKPLPNASVTFTPSNGRPSMGGTDENGHYSLRYTPTLTGARVGSVNVEIRTGNPDNLREFPETVPAKYNTKSELTAEVKPEPNVINFDLDAR